MTRVVAGSPAAVDAVPGRLLSLEVHDLALIDALTLSLGPGLNVITGETGAGKSLLIDALGLALGARADSGLVRHGAEAARVTAHFEADALSAEAGDLIVVREVTAAGRSSARLGGEVVPAARVAEVAGRHVEVHGQHDQQRLLDERRQRDLLDAHAGLSPERLAMAEAVTALRANLAALRELRLDPREVARRIALLDHEAEEIAESKLRVGEAAEIRERLRAAQHGEAIAKGVAALHGALTGETGSARDRLGIAVARARELVRLDARFDPLAERLAALQEEAADLATEAEDLAESIEHDPASLAKLDDRLSHIYELERRYGDGEEAILAHGASAAAEADRLRGLESERDRREAETTSLRMAVAEAASVLSRARRAAAPALAAAVDASLSALGFPEGAFQVSVQPRLAGGAGESDDAIEMDGERVSFDESGADEIGFRFAPNPGEPARSLAKIASGGELSRVALAIMEVLATADQTPTLVFDEIDTGIGGRSADPVGRSLWRLARRHQVLCVTHLPQIAAHADAHFQIRKGERNGRTITEVRRLTADESLVELAAMLGGGPGADGATAGAGELLDRVAAFRSAEASAG